MWNLLDKEQEASLNLTRFGTLRNKLQYCKVAPSITFLTPPSKLHEERATESLKLKGLASLAKRSRQGSRSLQVCWAALSCSDFHFIIDFALIFNDLSLILHRFSLILHKSSMILHWFSMNRHWLSLRECLTHTWGVCFFWFYKSKWIEWWSYN